MFSKDKVIKKTMGKFEWEERKAVQVKKRRQKRADLNGIKILGIRRFYSAKLN